MVFNHRMTTTPKVAETDIKVGDIIHFMGTPHLIRTIDQPSPASAAMGVEGIARDASGWGISLARTGVGWATKPDVGIWVEVAP